MIQSPSSLVIVERPAAGIGLLTLNRPDKLTAISTQVPAEVSAAIDRVESEPEIRILIGVITNPGQSHAVAHMGDLGDSDWIREEFEEASHRERGAKPHGLGRAQVRPISVTCECLCRGNCGIGVAAVPDTVAWIRCK